MLWVEFQSLFSQNSWKEKKNLCKLWIETFVENTIDYKENTVNILVFIISSLMVERNGKISHVFFHRSGAVFMDVQPSQWHGTPCLEVLF